MRSKLLALTLVAATGGGIGLFSLGQATPATAASPTQPPRQHDNPVVPSQSKVEVVFVLDTTGSMGDLIHAAKEKIWSIATTLASASQQPEVRIGLVAFRDRGDRYVTQVTDLSTDLDSVYARLMDYRAEGGGDTPESVNQALYDAVHKISWSEGQGTYRAVFLVGDAPPHMNYQDDVKYPRTLAQAKQRDIVVNAVLAGGDRQAKQHWQRIASRAGGVYAQVGTGGDAVAIKTPFDERLAALSRELDATRVFYGDEKQRKAMGLKAKAAEKLHREASVASRARRATFNSSESGKRNLLGESELVDDVASGRVLLEAVPQALLPAPLQQLSIEARRDALSALSKRREALQGEVKALAAQRKEYLRDQVKKDANADNSLDRQLFDAVRSQASGRGLTYSKDAESY